MRKLWIRYGACFILLAVLLLGLYGAGYEAAAFIYAGF